MTELSDAATRTLVRATRYAAGDANTDATIELGDLPEDELHATRELIAFLYGHVSKLCQSHDARANASQP